MIEIASIAEQLSLAKATNKAILSFSSQTPEFGVSQAYQVQEILFHNALAAGEKLCGYKMGLTSKAKQKDVNVFEPIRGFLLSSMEQKEEQLNVSSRIHPRVEPEVAVILKNTLKGEVSFEEMIRSVERVVPAIEILDSRFEGFSFSLPDVIADNTSASGFVLGKSNWLSRLSDLPLTGIYIRKNGDIVETGAPAAVLGNPLNSVLELLKSLAKENKTLEKGMVVLTGGITTSVPVVSGDLIEMVWPGETMVIKGI